MTRGAGEPSAKRAKVDEEEDPLVRRKEEVVRLLERASAKGKGNARAMKELLDLCTDLEAANCNELLKKLPEEVWEKIVKIIDDENEYVQQNDMVALASTCRFFREKQKGLGRKLKTYVNLELLQLRKSVKVASHSLDWYRWVCDTFEILPGFILPGFMCDDEERVEGAAYEGDLLNYAALQGSVEILRWLL